MKKGDFPSIREMLNETDVLSWGVTECIKTSRSSESDIK